LLSRVHIITSLGVGGAERMLQRLIMADPNSKAYTWVICLDEVGKVGLDMQAAGVSVYSLRLRRPFSFPFAFIRLIFLLRKLKPDIVQTWMYHADLFGGVAARLAGIKSVVWGIRRTAVPGLKKATRWVLRLSAMVSSVVPHRIVCVAYAARESHAKAGYNSKTMVVIPNGFDFEKFSPSLISSAMPDSAKRANIVVGCVCRYAFDKGQDLFVEAAALALRENPALRFTLIGKGCETSNPQLIEQLRRVGVLEHFTLLGERSDIPLCLEQMDIFCMPSRTEGFPNGLGEAMAMARPCIATAVGDTKILSGGTVKLVPPNDALAIAKALVEISLLTYEQRMSIGEKSLARVRSEFSIERARNLYEDLYKDLKDNK